MKKVIICAIMPIVVTLFMLNLGCEKSKDFSVGLIVDTGGINDKSFNQSTWEGIKQFTKKYKLNKGQYSYLISRTANDDVPNLTLLANNNVSLIVAPGFLFQNAISEVSTNFPKTHFLILDAIVTDSPNVVSAIFNEEQGSFLAGIVAGLKAQKKGRMMVGFLGGMELDVIHRFEAGFEAGLKAVAPNVDLLVKYAGSFDDQELGQELAEKMYDEGVYILFHAAAGTGIGVIQEAKARTLLGDTVYVIGVDKDQYEDGLYEDGKSVVLTSMIKRVDKATYDVAEMALKGNFPGGKVISFSLKNDGVGLSENNPNVSADIMSAVDNYKQKIIEGKERVPTKPSRL